MSLSLLPTELLLSLIGYLDNIEDFTNLTSTCRKLHSTATSTSPNTILRLAAASSRIFFRPSPHFLIAATAQQIGQWALLNNDNYEDLRAAFKGGIEGLFELCVSKAGLTLDDIRCLHSKRFTIINPASDMIDRCAGQQWPDVPEDGPNFFNGGRSDAKTLGIVDPERSLFQIVIYGELFRSTLEAAIKPVPNTPGFPLDMRVEYVKYCIPDYHCDQWNPGNINGGPVGSGPAFSTSKVPVGPANSDLQVLPIGPYTRSSETKHGYVVNPEADQQALDHILGCSTWCEAWEPVRLAIGPDFEEEWRQKLWESAGLMQGLDGLEMLRPGGVEKWRGRLRGIRGSIQGMQLYEKPEEHWFQRRGFSNAPCLADEVMIWDTWWL